jgi:UDPglucose 6-dehydrogenase
VDIDPKKVSLINNRKSPIADSEIEKYLCQKELRLSATMDSSVAYADADYVIVATPTKYDPEQNFFDTQRVEGVIKEATHANSQADIVIKSTVPVGFTSRIQKEYKKNNLLFSPEFLREGKALLDNLYPSRIIIGIPDTIPQDKKASRDFSELLSEGAIKQNIDILYMNSTEAEAVKLFANTYLALRVSFFN